MSSPLSSPPLRALPQPAITAVACVAVLFWLAHLGPSTRVRGAARCLPAVPVKVVRDTRSVYRALRVSGLRGRQLVAASRFLHFVPALDAISFDGLDRFPVQSFDLLSRYEAELDVKNLFWVAQRAAIVRRVVHLVPADVLDQKLAGSAGDEEAEIHGRAIRTSEHGSPRLIVDRLPPLDEPVLLVVDASFLKTRTPEETRALLLEAGCLRTDLVILSRAEDNPEVGPAERARLDALARSLEAGR